MRNEAQSTYFSESLEACLIDRFGGHVVHGYSRFFAEFTDGNMTSQEVAAVLLDDAGLYASFIFDKAEGSSKVEMPFGIREGLEPNRHIIIREFGNAVRRRGGTAAIIKFWQGPIGLLAEAGRANTRLESDRDDLQHITFAILEANGFHGSRRKKGEAYALSASRNDWDIQLRFKPTDVKRGTDQFNIWFDVVRKTGRVQRIIHLDPSLLAPSIGTYNLVASHPFNEPNPTIDPYAYWMAVTIFVETVNFAVDLLDVH